MSASKRILLVEDNSRDIELALSAFGEDRLAHEVAVVRDGAAAMDYLQCRGEFSARSGGAPAVVLLDIKLPKLSGLEVLHRMRADARLKHVPVVMLSSSRETLDLARAYELGANAYVVKPVDFNQLLQTMRLIGSFWVRINEPPPEACMP